MPRITDFMVLKQMPQPVLVIKKEISIEELPSVLAESYQLLTDYLNKYEELLTDLPFVAYHHVKNMQPDKVRIEIGFPVARELPGNEYITSDSLPEGNKVICLFRGNYNEILPTYHEMWEWIKENGYRDSNIAYEYYYNGPDCPTEELLTQIAIYIQ